jgi:serine protease
MNKFTGILLSTFLLFSSVAVAKAPYMPGQIVVKSGADDIEGYEVIKKLPKSGLTVLQVEKGKEFGQAMKLRKKGVSAHLNYIAHASVSPTDPFYVYQWHLPAIQLEQAWGVTRGAKLNGEPVRVAVLDTGIAYNGADGVNLCSSGQYDVVNSDGNPSDRSQLSHGTHVAGTISQLTSFEGAGTGAAGVAPEACVIPIKVLNDQGNGTFADIAEGIWHAVDVGAKVINMSLGVNAEAQIFSDSLIDPALNHAEQQNVLVVAAAGNDGFSQNVSYPAVYATVVAVGATDINDNVVGYSNRGNGLDIVAPGGDTSVDLNNDSYPDGVLQETKYRNKFGHYFLQGTSMASPHVAGVAALMFAYNFDSAAEVRNALMSEAKDLYSPGQDSISGFGLVQAFDSLLAGGTPSGPQPLALPTGLEPADGDENVSISTVLSWSGVTGAEGYRVEITGPNLAQPVMSEDLDSNTTSYSPAAGVLQYGQSYTWSVQAFRGSELTAASADFSVEADPNGSGNTLTDNDGDGYYAEVNDCDDNNSHIYPGHNDTKGRWGRDEVDNDCNGIIDG